MSDSQVQGTPPFVGASNEALQNFVKLLAGLAPAIQGKQGTPVPGGAAMPAGTPGIVGGPPPQMTPAGPAGPAGVPGNLPGLPGPAATATPSGPAGGPTPQHPAFSTGFEFATKGARNAAVVAGVMQNIAQTAEHIKKQKWEEEMRTAQGATSQIMFHEQRAAELAAQGDREGAQKEKQAADRIRQDKKVAKILEKASTDFGSAAYFGVQQAYQGEQQRAQAESQKAAVIAAAQQKAELERQQAAYAKAQAEALSPERQRQQHEWKMEEEKAKAQAEAAKQRPSFEVRGAVPRVWDPVTRRSYGPDDVKNGQAPQDIAGMIKDEIRSVMAGWSEQEKKAAQAQGAAMSRLMKGLDERGKVAMTKAWQPAADADFYLKDVSTNAVRAKKGDQQAQFKVISDFIASSLSLAKGTRITMAEWNQAQSKGLLAGIEARPITDADGNIMDIRMGVALPPETVDNMVTAVRSTFNERYEASRNNARNTANMMDVPFKEYEPLNPKPSGGPSGAGGAGGAGGAKPKVTIDKNGNVTIE